MPYWKAALLQIFSAPETFHILYEDDYVWVVQDKYPKAKVHLLVIPKEKLPDGLPFMNTSHIPLLEHMNEVANHLIQTKLPADTSTGYRVGFHRRPSLWQLHLHIISDDLSLAKTHRHWLSFQPANLISIDQAISTLNESWRI